MSAETLQSLPSAEPEVEDTVRAAAIAAFESEIEQEAEEESAVLDAPVVIEADVRESPPEVTDITPEDFEEASPPKKRFIIKETQVDKFNITRTRVELTPAVCDVCGFDVAQRNNLGEYGKVSEVIQAQIVEAIAEHKRILHSPAQQLIVDEEDLPTEWLGHPKF